MALSLERITSISLRDMICLVTSRELWTLVTLVREKKQDLIGKSWGVSVWKKHSTLSDQFKDVLMCITKSDLLGVISQLWQKMSITHEYILKNKGISKTDISSIF